MAIKMTVPTEVASHCAAIYAECEINARLFNRPMWNAPWGDYATWKKRNEKRRLDYKRALLSALPDGSELPEINEYTPKVALWDELQRPVYEHKTVRDLRQAFADAYVALVSK